MGKSRILVTGGAGFIGSNLVNGLLKNGTHEILVVDNLTAGNFGFTPPSGVDFECMDVANTEKIPHLVNVFKPEYVFHLAAHFANQNSVDFPFSDLDTNVKGTLNLLGALNKTGGLKKLVYASSSCVYGGEYAVMTEDQALYPHETPYAINKFVAELYAAYFNHLYKTSCASVRIFNTYGPGEMAGKYRNVIPNFIHKALHNEDITITGDGTETRDFTYVADTCDLLCKVAFNGSNEYAVYNGGTGRSVKIIDLANMIISLSGSKSKIIFKERRNWDLIKDRLASVEKAGTELGYKPTVGIEEGLSTTVEWYKEKIK